MFDFDDLGSVSREAPAQTANITVKQMTVLDELTDVGWLDGQMKTQMAQKFLSERGQYFDGGVRVTGNGCAEDLSDTSWAR